MKRLLLSLMMVALTVCTYAQSMDRVFSGKQYLNENTLSRTFNAMKLYSNRGVTTMNKIKTADTNAEGLDVITDQPAGEERTYLRKGTSLYSTDGRNVVEGAQVGFLKTVFATDGSVYFYEIISATSGGGTKSWVKGTLSADGKTITVPLKQNVLYLPENKCYIQLNMVNYDKATNKYELDKTATEAKFTVEGDVIRLEGTSREHFLGLTYSDDSSWTMYGDYNTSYVVFKGEELTPPAELKTEKMILSCVDAKGVGVSSGVEIGFVGNDVYVKGLCYETSPKAWIKGVKEGNTLTFKSGQYMGIYMAYYPMFFVGCNVKDGMLELGDFKLYYDEATGKYTSNMYVLENVVDDDILYLNSLHNIVLNPLPDIEISTEIIREQPAGEMKTYTRKGMSYCKNFGTIYQEEQTGFLMNMVFAQDGKTVYIKDPITQVSANTWVKGTKEGNKIVVPLYQTIDYSEEGHYGVVTCRLVKTGENAFVPDLKATQMTYAIDETTGVISLEGTEKGNVIYGLIFTNNYQWNGFGDYESVYTPLEEKATMVPENLERQSWIFSYSEEGKGKYHNVTVSIDGAKMYIAGLPMLNPDAAVVGTIQGDKVVFESDQCLGKLDEMDAIAYFGGAKYRIEEIVYPGFGSIKKYRYDFLPALEMTYDKEHQILTAGEKATFLINAGKPSVNIAYVVAAGEPKFNVEETVSHKPKAPEFTLFEDFSAEEGYYNVELTAVSEDLDGRFIVPENMSYQIFIMKKGQAEPYVFLKSFHTKLTEDMATVPFIFSDNMTIGKAASYLYIYGKDIENIGIELINATGDKEARSDRVWAKTISGIDASTMSDKKVKEVQYYTVEGIRVNAPEKGFNIVKTVYTDGTSKTAKICKR